MAKKIYTVLKLKDEFTKPLKNATKEEKAFAKQAKVATAQVNAFASKAKGKFTALGASAKSLATALTGIGAAITVAGAVSFGKDAIEAAKAQIEAETKLEAVLGNIPAIAQGGTQAIKEAKDQLTGVASELQKVGVIGDEVTIAGQQQMATYQLSTDSLSTLSKGMTDLLAQQYGLNATQENAVGIANMIGKAMSGQTSALSRAGIIMTEEQKQMMKVGDETQRAATLAQILQDNVGGVNEALAQTDQGKIQQATNNIGDLKEEIGKKLLPVVANAMSYINDHLPQIQAAIEAAGNMAKKAFSAIGKAISFVKDNASWLVPVLSAVVSGFVAFKVVTKVAAGIKALTTAVTVLKLAFTASTIAISPLKIILTVVAAIIGFLIAKFRDLYKNNEKFRNNVDKVVAVMKKFGAAVQKAFSAIGQAIGKVVSWLGEKLKPVFEWLKAQWDAYVQKVAAQTQALIEKIKPIIEKLKPVFEKIRATISKIVTALAPIVSKVASVIGKVVSVIVKVIGKIVSVIAKIIGTIVTIVVKVVTTIVNVITTIVSAIVKVVTGIVNAIKKVITGIKNFISNIINTIKKIFDGLKEKLTAVKDAFVAITEPIRNTFQKIKEVIQGVIDKVKSLIDWITRANGTEVTVHEDHDSSGSDYATGTTYAPAGLHRVNEYGGEIMNLPGGTQVIPHDISEKMAKNSGSKVNVTVNIQGNVVGNESFANYIGDIIAKKIVKAEGVM